MFAPTGHRPWPLPRGPWIVAMKWHDLLFAHWPVPPDILRPRLPPGLTLDIFEGQPWLGVVPFRMTGVRPRGIPPLPGLSAFPELNVRTYVTAGGKPGVFFFSLDAGSRFAVEAARWSYCLPNYHARMSVSPEGEATRYASRRLDPRGAAAELRARYRPVGAPFRATAGSLEYFVSERYCLYTSGPRGDLRRAEIHHAPWPLRPAEATFEVDTIAAAPGIRLPATPPLLQFARRLDVVVWPLRPA